MRWGFFVTTLLSCLLLAGQAAAQRPAPNVPEGSVVNGASFEEGQAVAPGSIISIFGTNLAVTFEPGDTVPMGFTRVTAEIPLATSLGGLSVRINDMEAPLFFVSEGQINAQLPWEIEPSDGTATLLVRREDDDGTRDSEPIEIPLNAVSPGIFTLDFGPGPAAAINVKLSEDDDVIAGSFALSQETLDTRGLSATGQPAVKGGVITVFANGLGPVDPPAETGDDSIDDDGAPVLREAETEPILRIGGEEADVIFAGLAPQFVGLNQINAFVPENIESGDQVPIEIEIDGIVSRDDVYIAVRDAPAAAALTGR